MATWSWTKVTPLVVQAAPSLASSGLIGREASLMSVSSAQNLVNPPPVPDSLTLMSTPGLAALNSSATASEIGRTVLEPSTTTLPVTGAVLGAVLAALDGAPLAAVLAAVDGAVLAPLLEQALNATAATIARAATGLNLEMVTDSILLHAARWGWARSGFGDSSFGLTSPASGSGMNGRLAVR